MIREWIVTLSGTNIEGAVVRRVLGTDEQIQEYLIQMIKEDIENDKERFDCGTTEIKDLVINVENIYGYTVFTDYHIDYQAVLLNEIDRIELSNMKEEIVQLLDDKISEVYCHFQEKLNIRSGDIYIDELFEQDKIIEKLAELIEKVLAHEREV